MRFLYTPTSVVLHKVIRVRANRGGSTGLVTKSQLQRDLTNDTKDLTRTTIKTARHNHPFILPCHDEDGDLAAPGAD